MKFQLRTYGVGLFLVEFLILGQAVQAQTTQDQTTTYSFEGLPFNSCSNASGPVNCPRDGHIAGSFTLVHPLAANYTSPGGVGNGPGDLNPVSFCFTDGIIALTNLNVVAPNFTVMTDPQGNLAQWSVSLFAASGLPNIRIYYGPSSRGPGFKVARNGIQTSSYENDYHTTDVGMGGAWTTASGSGGSCLGPRLVLKPTDTTVDGTRAVRVEPGPGKQINFTLSCLDLNDQPVDECKYNLSTKQSGFDGGHLDAKHTTVPRPLPCLRPLPSCFPVSDFSPVTNGMQITLTAPQAAAQFTLDLKGQDKDGNDIQTAQTNPTSVQVRIATDLIDLGSIAFPDLIFSVMSHPAAGTFGTDDMFHRVAVMMASFDSNISLYEKIPPVFQCTGVSLKWGGLFDINLNYNTPHETHRDGKAIDIDVENPGRGFHPFTDLELRVLETAFQSAGFIARVGGEKPGDVTRAHWHLQPGPSVPLPNSSSY